ncbi:MAG TPA: cyclic pyranopterin monophosphate synthase MoaC [Mycobacteriales bacterium]|nr:cyclic pyranopterin monophosphate synthase MoaC [Mycobacteriales bacterium]
MSDDFTHLDEQGQARMVDVSGKDVTTRTATASGLVRTTPEVLARLADATVPKGDVLAVARIAGIMGAKRTSELIPLCHPIGIDGIEVTAEVVTGGVRLTAELRTAERTGIEMEALTAVAVAGLSVIDMIKALDRGAQLTDVRVEAKAGGRSGEYRR